MSKSKKHGGRPSKPEDEKWKQFSVTLPPDMHAALEAFCQANDPAPTHAAVMRSALRAWLETKGNDILDSSGLRPIITA